MLSHFLCAYVLFDTPAVTVVFSKALTLQVVEMHLQGETVSPQQRKEKPGEKSQTQKPAKLKQDGLNDRHLCMSLRGQRGESDSLLRDFTVEPHVAQTP